MGKVVQREVGQQSFDRLKWGLVWLMIFMSAGLNLYYSDRFSLILRISAMILVAFVIFFVAGGTVKGQLAFKFIKDARIEMRKIVWPTRPETVQTTMVVSIFVVFMSLVLWGFDVLFASLISRIVG